LVTGVAGFIGSHLAERLLAQGDQVIGVDCFTDYYPRWIKEKNKAKLDGKQGFELVETNLQNMELKPLLARVNNVFHLAAQAGVRYSLENPEAYLRSNVDATLNLLEAARFAPHPPHLMLASSSSVYGASARYPYREDDPADRPLALYGATKRADELMGHVYAHLFGLRVTMLRFFTVYGPWGRPDMALFRFVEAILADREVELYNGGDMVRDFTYIDDIVDGLVALEAARTREDQPAFDVFNLGAGQPRPLRDFLEAIEASLGRKARVKEMPFQSGDVYKTHADTTKARQLCGYSPKTSIQDGIARFVDWFRTFYPQRHSPEP
jgi:UDP-glucuronate 4-epimerase